MSICVHAPSVWICHYWQTSARVTITIQNKQCNHLVATLMIVKHPMTATNHIQICSMTATSHIKQKKTTLDLEDQLVVPLPMPFTCSLPIACPIGCAFANAIRLLPVPCQLPIACPILCALPKPSFLPKHLFFEHQLVVLALVFDLKVLSKYIGGGVGGCVGFDICKSVKGHDG